MSFREMAQEHPGVVALSLVAHFGVGVFRPRWLTVAARRTPRQWLRLLAIDLVFVAAIEWLRPMAERSQMAREELQHELGRDPTVEEHHARMEDLKRQDTRTRS
jgi:hypothetical protein